MDNNETMGGNNKKESETPIVKNVIIMVLTFMLVLGYMALAIWIPIPFRKVTMPLILILGILMVFIVNSQKRFVRIRAICVIELIFGILILLLVVLKKPSGTSPEQILFKYYPISETNYVKLYDDGKVDNNLRIYLDKNVNNVYYCVYNNSGKKTVLDHCFRVFPAWTLDNYEREIERIEKKLLKDDYISDGVLIVSLYEVKETPNYKKDRITLKEKISLANNEVYVYWFSKSD